MTDSHNITISVDASSARAELRSLSQQVTSTSNALRQLNGSAGGGSAFTSLSRGLADTSRGFSELKRQTSDSGLSNLSREISMLSRGMPVLAREIVAVGSAFIVSKSAVTLFAGALGSAALAEFAGDVQKVGNSLLSFRIGIDAVSASSKEQGAALSFIRDAATRIGAPLDSATDSFKALYVNMRSLGRPVDEITKVFSGFQTAMTALHISSRDQALSWREIAETYSQGVIHTRQAILSLGSHIPGMAANLQQALGVSGEKLHAMFKAGGLPLDTWTKVAALLEKQYGAQIPEAFRHSQQNIVALQNSFTQFKQVVFDSGFDSGFTTFLKSLQSGLDSIGLDNIGKRIGEAFRVGFTAASLMLEKIIALREPITFVAQALLGYAAASAAIRLAAGAVALLFSPLAMAAAGAVLLTTQWDSLKSVFSGGDSAFNAGAEAIKRLTGGYLDLQKAIKGAVELWELSKGLFSGNSFAESRGLAAQAGQDFDAGEYGRRSGTDFTSGFIERASTLFGKLGDVFKLHVPDIGMKTLGDDWSRLYKQTEPTAFHGGGDYAGNAARYAKPDLSLSEELKKVYERLLPTNKALAEYRQQLESIAKMRGKLDPLSGKAIGDEEIHKLRDAAREEAFRSSFPAANKISEMVDKLRLEQEAIANAGGLSNKEAMQQEREFLQIKLEMKRKHVDLTHEETAALRDLIRAEHELTKGGANGFTQWANSQKSAVDSMNDNIKSGMDSVADGIAKIAVEGKGKFSSLGAAIRNEFADIAKSIASNFLKAGIRDLMAQAIKGMNLDSSLTSTLSKAIGGGKNIIDKANGELDKIAGSISNTAEMSVNAGVVYLNGATIGASGLDAFKPGTSLQDSINPKAVGGVEKTASESLFASSATSANASGFALQNGVGRDQISANSIQRFAQVLAPWKGDAPDSITRDSVSEFGQIINLQKTQPLAEQIGVNAPKSLPSASFGKSDLESLYQAAGLDKSTERALRSVKPQLQSAVLQAKQESGASIYMNDGMGLRTQAQAAANAAAGRGILRSRHLTGDAADVLLKDQNGKIIADGSNPAYSRFNDSVQRAAARDGNRIDWGGNWKSRKDWDHWEIARGNKPTPVSERSFTNYAGSDVDAFRRATRLTEGRSAFAGNSLKPLSDSTQKVAKDFERNMRAASDKFAPEFAKDLDNATKSAGNGGGSGDIGKATSDATKNVNQQSADATGSLTQLGGSIANLATNSKNAPSAIAGVAQSIMNLISQLSSGAGGGGGAGGLIGGAVSLLGGLFEEGGLSGSAVTSAAMPASYWAGAPAYAEGTPNTSGGMPAILHDNEAVIPLSRGREIPVQLNGAGGGGDTHIHNHMNQNIQAKDHDSFRRNTNQMAADFHKMAARMHVRNN